MDNIGYCVYNDTLVREEISKNFKKNQIIRCFNIGKQSHLKKECRQDILERMFFS